MMRKSLISLVVFILSLTIGSSVAQDECAQDATGKPQCTYEALYAKDHKPVIDGKLNDWRYAEGVFIGEDFWEANGENYSGDDDLSATWWVLWNEDNLYVAVEVVDDKHQNTKAGDQIWDGDAVQFTLDPTGKKSVYSGVCYEYGYSLTEAGVAVWRWSTNTVSAGENSEYAIVRDEDKETTTYEIRIPAGDIAPMDLSAEEVIGWAIIVNDSDTCDCQGGWVGWASSALVWGKEANVLADLFFSPEKLAVSPKEKFAALWGKIKAR